VHLDKLAVDADRGAAGSQAEHGVATFAPAFPDYFSDALGDRSGDLVVLDDYYGDAFLGGGHA